MSGAVREETFAVSPEAPKAIPVEPEKQAPPPQVEEDKVSKTFALLSKKEKALYRQQEVLKQEKAAIAAEKARVAELEAKYGSKPATPREALERYGFDYKQATEYELNDGSPTAEHIARMAQEEVKRLREEQAAKEKRALEDAAQRAQQEKLEIIEDFKSEINQFIDEKPDDFELIKFYDYQDVVYQTIEEHYQRTNRLLSIQEGANLVEKYLESRAEKLQATKKFAKLRGDSAQKEPDLGFRSHPAPSAQQLSQTRTIDNSATSSLNPTLVRSSKIEDDRIARALAALDRR